MSDAPGEKRPAKSSKALWRKALERRGPLTSLVLTIPVFLVYHLGILLIDLRNGVDLITGLTFQLLEQSVAAYIGVTLGLSALLVGALVFLRSKHDRFNPRELLPVLGESAVLAVGMLLIVGWATGAIFDGQTGGQPMGFIDRIVMACGAGFHEEVIFRVVLFAGGAFVLRRFPFVGELTAILAAALISSVVFSAVHYVGSMGDSFTLVSFVFRTIAGLYLTAVFSLRGFAVAVYTHTAYDLLVFFVV